MSAVATLGFVAIRRDQRADSPCRLSLPFVVGVGVSAVRLLVGAPRERASRTIPKARIAVMASSLICAHNAQIRRSSGLLFSAMRCGGAPPRTPWDRTESERQTPESQSRVLGYH